MVDRYLYERILFNLLSNAVKFTDAGGKVAVSLTEKEGMFVLAVKDTGIGIASQDQTHIFHHFRQVEGSSTRRFEGTGLGLTLAKKFVELHGGRIWVVSAVGTGSTFSFTIPLERPTPAASA